MAAGALVAFGVVSTVVGLVLALGDGPGWLQQVGFAFYAAGSPVSGIFAAVAGELPVAPFTDVVIWLILAVGAARLSDRSDIALHRVIVGVILGVAVLGIAVSFLIERV